MLIVNNGNQRLEIWPEPPKVPEKDRPEFCPKAHRADVVELYRKHLHYHPEIPFDSDGTYLTAKQIHEQATHEMYTYCFTKDLSQVWAYMWNRWYCPTQWMLWATSACEEIPRIKTTMIVESLWRQFKHRELAHFNRPRLDLVAYLLITRILERVKRTLDLLRDIR
jgi:hypothetical protein